MITNSLWLFVTGVGPFLLAAVIVVVFLWRRRLTAAEREASSRKVERLYTEEDAEDLEHPHNETPRREQHHG